MTTLVVAHHVSLFRAKLISALQETGLDVVGEADSAAGAIAKAEKHLPDLVLLDTLMPDRSGLDAVAQITVKAPDTRIVLLTDTEAAEEMLDGLKLGVRGYISRDTPFPILFEAVRSVANGGAALSPQMASKLLDKCRPLLRLWKTIQPNSPKLTRREVEVLQLVAHGMTSREIGDDLYISENTVRNHIRNILDKLGLHSRHEAVLHAVRENLISIPVG